MVSKSVLVIFSLVALVNVSFARHVFPVVVCPTSDNPSRQAVFLANPWDCSSYYECSNGTPYLMHCPAGLFFDIELTTCNYEEQVRCGWRRKTIDVEPKVAEAADNAVDSE